MFSLLFFFQFGKSAKSTWNQPGKIHVCHPYIIETVQTTFRRNITNAERVQRQIYQIIQVRQLFKKKHLFYRLPLLWGLVGSVSRASDFGSEGLAFDSRRYPWER